LFSGEGHLLDLLGKVRSERGQDGVEKMKTFSLDFTELPKVADQYEVKIYTNIRDLLNRSNELAAKKEQAVRPILLSALKNAAQEPGFDISHSSLKTIVKRPEVQQAVKEILNEQEGNEIITNLTNIKNELSAQRSSFEEIAKEKEIMH
jgi:hypothetical protein